MTTCDTSDDVWQDLVSSLWQPVMLVMMYDNKTFKTDVIFVINTQLCILCHNDQLFSVSRVRSLLLTISIGEIKGQMSKLQIIT